MHSVNSLGNYISETSSRFRETGLAQDANDNQLFRPIRVRLGVSDDVAFGVTSAPNNQCNCSVWSELHSEFRLESDKLYGH